MKRFSSPISIAPSFTDAGVVTVAVMIPQWSSTTRWSL